MLKHTLNFYLTFCSKRDKTCLTQTGITQNNVHQIWTHTQTHTHTHFSLPQKTTLKNCLLCFDNEACTAQAKHQIISFLPDLELTLFQMTLLPQSTLMNEATGSSKLWHISTRLQGVTFQKLQTSVMFTVTKARISSLTGFTWFQKEARIHSNKLPDYFIGF